MAKATLRYNLIRCYYNCQRRMCRCKGNCMSLWRDASPATRLLRSNGPCRATSLRHSWTFIHVGARHTLAYRLGQLALAMIVDGRYAIDGDNGLGAAVDAKFLQDRGNMGLHGCFRHAELESDLLIEKPLAQHG